MRKLFSYLALVIALGAGDLSWATLDPAQSEREAEAAIQESHYDLQKNPPKDPEGSVGYAGTNIPEAHYNEATIEEKKFKAAASNEAYKLVKDSIDQRPPYEIDVVNDPLFKESDQYLNHPGGQLVWNEERDSEDNRPSRHTCTVGRQVYETQCYFILVPRLLGTRKVVKTKHIPIAAAALNNINLELSLQLMRTMSCRCWCRVFCGGRSPFTDKGSLTHFLTGFRINDPEVTPETIESLKIHSHNGQCEDQMYGVFGCKYPPGFVKASIYTLEVTYLAEVPAYTLVWESGCEELEKAVDEGKCELISRHCIEPQETRVIDGEELSADCWKEELRYRCHTPQINNCKSLLEKGCIQVASRCKTEYQGECLEWEQTFECYDKPQRLAQTRLKEDMAFCLDGNCVNQTWDPNPDMADSLSKLAIFKEMQKDMDPNTQTVFRGEDLRCSRIPASFKNCCSQKGWGMKVGMAGCSENEKKLAQQRRLNKCVMVGTYCAEKKLGICVKKKTTFCCYQTRLARILNEQGRGQLGLHYGDPENPQCQGLTLTQFSKVDFSKLNLTELFQDLFSKIQMPDTQKITHGIQQSIRDQSRLITDKNKRMTQGRPNGEF